MLQLDLRAKPETMNSNRHFSSTSVPKEEGSLTQPPSMMIFASLLDCERNRRRSDAKTKPPNLIFCAKTTQVQALETEEKKV